MAIATKELKRLRLSQDLTQKNLADAIGVSSARYSSWERGEKQPSSENIQKLAETLKCSINKLVEQSKETKFDIEIFNDKNPSFSYFVNERKDQKIRSHDALILKINIFDYALLLELSSESEKKSLNSILRGEHDFIWVETYDDKMFYVNTDCIEWAIWHDDGADEYPEICEGKFHETPLLKADVTKNAVLFMMAKNGNHEVNGDCNFDLSVDFEWLIEHQSRLIEEAPDVIKSLKENLGENYINFLNDTEKTEYEREFINAWGIRIFLKGGKEIFLPGMYSRGEAWDEPLIDIQNMNLYDDHHVTNFSDHETNNHYLIPTNQIAFIEYPNVFNAIGNYAEYEKISLLDTEIVDKTVEELSMLAWQD